MEDLFKKVFYTGVGMVSTTTETIQNAIDELVQKGKISEEEGEKVVSNFEQTFSEKKEEFEGVVTNAVGLAMAKLNLPSADVINRLEKRIKSLEIKVGLLTKEMDEQPVKKVKKTATTTAKKAATRVKKAVAGVKRTTRRKVAVK